MMHTEVSKLLQLILVDMAAATNRDQAADGPVGDEEEGVWARIEAQARIVRETMSEPDRSDGAALIASERVRQMVEEGYTHHHDDDHAHGELTYAAAAYALVTPIDQSLPRILWPWGHAEFKPDVMSPIANLVKAGALIAAEIDRVRRFTRP